MPYSHQYHAGSAADVFKHLVLVLLIKALTKKEKPLLYLDTHTGEALYDLQRKESQATAEFQQGIAKLWEEDKLSSEIQAYLNIIKSYNQQQLRYYPGSARIAKSLLRPNDRLILIERDHQVCLSLKRSFVTEKQVKVYEQDAYQALQSFTPPKERRGLVLIDPPYETTNEFKVIVEQVLLAYRKWATGVYAIWYPIKDLSQVKDFYHLLKSCGIPNILVAEFCLLPSDVSQRLNGSGMIIINPPWQVDLQLQSALPQLLNILKIHPEGSAKIYWL